MKIRILVALICISTSVFAITVDDLKCEYRVNPLGIDAAQSHLSWIVQSSDRGEAQTAYQVLAATSPVALAHDRGDLWDTGKVVSSDTLGIVYTGQTLKSSQEVFWKVRVWDANARVSAWSGISRWTMGVLEPAAWHAKWISAAGAESYAVSYDDAARHDFRDRAVFATMHPNAVPTGEPNFSSMLIRREFTVKPGLTRALVHVSGLGQYELSINGAKSSEDVLSPGWTDYRKTVLYDTHDITRQLVPGPNAIGLLLGNGMYNIQPDFVRYVKFLNSYGPLKAIAQIRLEYQDGHIEFIGTDRTWQVSPGPLTYSNIFGGEDYDARRINAGWDKSGGGWGTAWASAQETSGPGGALRGLSVAAPQIKVIQTLTPLKCTRINATTWVYDLGQNASIIPRLRVRGNRGSAVRIIPSELLGPDGRVDRTSATQDGVRPAWWQYTLASDRSTEWQPSFFYQGGRYLQVELAMSADDATLPVVEDLAGLVVHTSASSIGEFSCSNELFNRIYNLVRWAQRSNLMSTITDCPHREKMGWLEQYHLNGPSLRYNFDLLTLYRKAMNDMADSQLPNGFVPNIAPEFFVAGGEELTNGFRNSPEWGSAFILVPWQQYLFSGDVTLITDYYDRMKRYLTFLASTADDNIIKFGLGDWYDLGPKAPWGSQLTPVPLTATAIYYYDNLVMAEMAKRIGRNGDARAFLERAQVIRTSFNRAFFDAERGVYATGSQTANALPLVFGLVDPPQRKRVGDALVADIRARGNAFTSGDVGYRFLLKALAMEGHSDVIFDMNNQAEKPGYGYQIKNGATALTEKWDASVGSFGSQNHFMLGQINEWFYHDLAGIQPDESVPGFKSVFVKPNVVGDVQWVKSRYDTVRGPVIAEWTREGAKLTLDISIPANCTATVFVPGLSSAEVTESGVPAAVSPHVRWLREENGSTVYSVESGRYHFRR
jgi:alpha-L-rhamnosidase